MKNFTGAANNNWYNNKKYHQMNTNPHTFDTERFLSEMYVGIAGVEPISNEKVINETHSLLPRTGKKEIFFAKNVTQDQAEVLARNLSRKYPGIIITGWVHTSGVRLVLEEEKKK
jgi:hypothetical protein